MNDVLREHLEWQGPDKRMTETDTQPKPDYLNHLPGEFHRRDDESTEEYLDRIHGSGASKELRIAAATEYLKECKEEFGVDADKKSFAHGFMYGIKYARERCFDQVAEGSD